MNSIEARDIFAGCPMGELDSQDPSIPRFPNSIPEREEVRARAGGTVAALSCVSFAVVYLSDPAREYTDGV